jgi:eukaryotic-like serine/threonine-protein kinase
VEHHTDEPTHIERMEGPPPGTVLLDKYRVDWMLGVGGYGYVVRAHDIQFGHQVAIKILRDDREADPQTQGRFLREAKLALKLKSEHVARVIDVGRMTNNSPYIIMELLEGEDLGQLLDAGPLPVSKAVDYILQACEAIAEAHALGIVHRDLKPQNLFLQRLPATSKIKVLDFGISKTSRMSLISEPAMKLTQTQSILGTPAYMSPEQMRDARHVDYRTDIWALGVVLYELVENRLPFNADNFAELVIAVSTTPPEPLVLAPELHPAIQGCLAKNIDDRFATIAQLADAIAPFGSPGTAAEYLGRIHHLSGTAPPLIELPAKRTPTPVPGSLSPVLATIPVGPDTPTELVRGPSMLRNAQATIEDRPRRRSWLPFLLVALIASAATAAVVFAMRGRGGATDERAQVSPPPVAVDAAVAPPPIDAAAIVIDAADVAPPADAAIETAGSQKIVRPVKPIKPGSTPRPGSNRPDPDPGSNKGSNKRSTKCPDGTDPASYQDGRCPKR